MLRSRRSSKQPSFAPPSSIFFFSPSFFSLLLRPSHLVSRARALRRDAGQQIYIRRFLLYKYSVACPGLVHRSSAVDQSVIAMRFRYWYYLMLPSGGGTGQHKDGLGVHERVRHVRDSYARSIRKERVKKKGRLGFGLIPFQGMREKGTASKRRYQTRLGSQTREHRNPMDRC